MIDFERDGGGAFLGGHDTSSRSNPSSAMETWTPVIRERNEAPSALVRAIEDKIIPRLLIAHRLDTVQPRQDGLARNQHVWRDILAFTEHAIAGDREAMHTAIAAMRARGMSLESVFLDIVAPTAEHLGELWCSDDCGFLEVTIALGELQRLLRDFSQDRLAASYKPNHRILLAAAPSDQHSFGVLMVEEFFRRAGWATVGIPGATAKDIVETVRKNWFDVVGLSMAGDAYAARLPALIASLRKMSRNPSILVLVGGSYFNQHPGQAHLVGADATAHDARNAVAQSQRALRAVSRH